MTVANDTRDDQSDHLSIVELRLECVTMRRWNEQLFELLGAWVATTREPRRQQWFALACHRHAWHDELWSQRTPTIPSDDRHEAATPHADPTDRAAWYTDELGRMRRSLEQLARRVDDRLDPSTARAISLVVADIADLERRAPH